jgi:uncharacterized membrane protein YdbT with pleckstrin-like domain
MAARSIDFGKLNTDKTDSHGVILTVRPDMRLVKVSFLAPVAILLVGGITYLLPLPIDRQFINYLVLPFIAMVAVGVAVYPAGMYEALSRALFTLTDEYVEEEVGIIWKRTRRIPLGYVRDVTYGQNLIQGIFGVSDITVSTTNGDKIVLNNVKNGARTREIIWELILSKSPSPQR